jgi:hypothetical protein
MLHGRHSAGSRLLFRLLGRHPRFLPVTRGARATSTGSLRTHPHVGHLHHPGEVRLPSTRVHVPRLQGVLRAFLRPRRTIILSSGLQPSQKRKSALPFPGHAERFLPHAAATQAPLHDILSGPRVKGSHPIIWTPELHEAFEECKASFSCATLLAHPDPSASLAVVTGTSASTMGAVLQQRVKNAW